MNTTNLISKEAKTKIMKNGILSNQRSGNSVALNGQYKLIRKDVLKLGKDLARGYELLRGLVETKISRRSLSRAK